MTGSFLFCRRPQKRLVQTSPVVSATICFLLSPTFRYPFRGLVPSKKLLNSPVVPLESSSTYSYILFFLQTFSKLTVEVFRAAASCGYATPTLLPSPRLRWAPSGCYSEVCRLQLWNFSRIHEEFLVAGSGDVLRVFLFLQDLHSGGGGVWKPYDPLGEMRCQNLRNCLWGLPKICCED